ncbi:hypothetical protein NL676_020662 [Syzygium grande]|nr:hypothetical protein NL676_020662 [Syzygium grande]
MRRLPPLASRASTALTTLSDEAFAHKKLLPDNPSKPQPKPPVRWGDISRAREAPGGGKPLHDSGPSDSFPREDRSSRDQQIDRRYISRVLSRKDWFLLLTHEHRAKRAVLSAQSVASVLQNQENPVHPLKFYIWVSSFSPGIAKNRSVRAVLANALHRKGPVVLSAELIQDVRSSGGRFTEDLLCVLIGSWGRLGLAKYCDEVFGQISFLGFSPTTRIYNAVIDALVKANSLDKAYLKFQQMAADNCKPDRFTYNILVHGVCRAGVMDEARRLVKQMEGVGYKPNVYTYTILIDGFCNAKMADEAFKVIETMRKRNVPPNEATIRSLVHGVFRCTDAGKAFELLCSFVEREPSLIKFTCDTLLFCLSNNSMAREAAGLLRKFGERGYVPDGVTFNIAIVCLVKGLDLNEVLELLDRFNKRGVKPGFSTYYALIEALYKAGRIQDGDQYLNRIFEDGQVSNVFRTIC